MRSLRETMKKIICLYALFTVSAWAETPTVASLRLWQAQQERVSTLAWPIRLAALSRCLEKQYDYGLIAVSLDRTTKPEIKEVWQAAFKIDAELSTVISVLPNSPATQAGVQIGDVIVAVNGVRGQSDLMQAYRQSFNTITANSSLHVRVRRDEGVEVELTLDGVRTCALGTAVGEGEEVNARAIGQRVVVDSGLERLLKEDDQLAFVIAHEIAHVLLGHTDPAREKDINNKPIRIEMEKSADALGVELMYDAGYPPEAAGLAHAQIGRATHGFFSRLFGWYGPYLPTEQRVNFLNAEAQKVRQQPRLIATQDNDHWQ